MPDTATVTKVNGLAIKLGDTFTVPSVVNGFPVIAATKIKPRGGEYPDQWVVICDRATGFDRYVVWYAYLINDRPNDDEPMLSANDGLYTSDRNRALAEFVRRIDRRGLAES